MYTTLHRFSYAEMYLTVQGIVLCPHFETLHTSEKCHETIYLQFSKEQNVAPKMHCGRTGEIIAASDFKQREG